MYSSQSLIHRNYLHFWWYSLRLYYYRVFYFRLSESNNEFDMKRHQKHNRDWIWFAINFIFVSIITWPYSSIQTNTNLSLYKLNYWSFSRIVFFFKGRNVFQSHFKQYFCKICHRVVQKNANTANERAKKTELEDSKQR